MHTKYSLKKKKQSLHMKREYINEILKKNIKIKSLEPMFPTTRSATMKRNNNLGLTPNFHLDRII
jgi:hypothetical protein